MIIVQVIGGLGNQLFQYAMARSLSVRLNTSVKLDITYLLNRSKRNYLYRHFSLKNFNIILPIAENREIRRFITPRYKNTLLYALNKIFKKRVNVYIENGPGFDPFFYNIVDNLYLIGYWQSPRYFIEINELLKFEFTLRDELDPINKNYLRMIENLDSVSIHIRGSDYFSKPENYNLFSRISMTYYLNSVKYILEKVKNPTFFVFTDDTEYAQNILKTMDIPLTMVSHNNEPTKGYLDFYLMSQCKHNIIVNSTFSWWAAWLNPNPEKIVICPSTWYRKQGYENVDLIIDNWVKFPNE